MTNSEKDGRCPTQDSGDTGSAGNGDDAEDSRGVGTAEQLEGVHADDVLLRYLPGDDSYAAGFDPAAVPPSYLVPVAVAALRGVAVDALPPLHYSLDPTALDRLCHNDDASVTFVYADYQIAVESAGELRVRTQTA
ncbi:HalOD1 output domain-containing protein [Halobaculum halobium]|uniref:HalOD1 output domain-containing protein n=1 Tax=Halobaculum halobium TaxID=3032281 RepID=A0ABD5T982_9EURY|nr:HalOD1 output domain-containing protein [Halobaculum sp. SYNS20]